MRLSRSVIRPPRLTPTLMMPALAAGVADADGDLVDELVGEVVDARALEERQRGVAADEAGAGDDVHAGLRRQRLVVVDVAAVADAGGVDEGRRRRISWNFRSFGHGLLVALLGGLPPLGVQLGAGHAVADVLVDGDEAEFLGGDRAPGRCSLCAHVSCSFTVQQVARVVDEDALDVGVVSPWA